MVLISITLFGFVTISPAGCEKEMNVFSSPVVWQAPSNFSFTPRVCLLPCIHPLHLSSFAILVSLFQDLFIILFKCLHPRNSEVTLSRLIWFITDNPVDKERLCTCALNSFIWLETKISLWYVILKYVKWVRKQWHAEFTFISGHNFTLFYLCCAIWWFLPWPSSPIAFVMSKRIDSFSYPTEWCMFINAFEQN